MYYTLKEKPRTITIRFDVSIPSNCQCGNLFEGLDSPNKVGGLFHNFFIGKTAHKIKLQISGLPLQQIWKYGVLKIIEVQFKSMYVIRHQPHFSRF